MSVEAISWAFNQDPESSGAKLLLVAIANHAGQSGVAFPGRETLAEDCSLSRTASVTDNMKRLVDQGLVARFERRRKNGSKTSDWLVLAPRSEGRGPMKDASPEDYPEEVALAATRPGSGTDSVGTDSPRSQVRKTGGPPEPSEEPSEQTEPPQPPASGGRRRDRDRFEDDCKAYAAEHFPDLGEQGPTAVAQAARNACRTHAEVVAFIDRWWRKTAA